MSDTPYGITMNASSASGTLSGQAITDMQSLGITWLRYLVPWKAIDTSGTTNQNAANYVWTSWDSAVQQCNAVGINICLVVFHAPSQFTTSDNPLAPQPTATFATQIANRYNGGAHGRVNAIEIGNEDYNSGTETTSIPVTSVQSLVATLNTAYPAIKAVNAHIKVGAAAKLQRNSAGYAAWFDTLLNPAGPPKGGSGNPYGVTVAIFNSNIYQYSSELFADCKTLGIGWIRFQQDWGLIETSPGSYNWKALDDMVGRCNAADIRIQFPIRNAPDFSTTMLVNPGQTNRTTCNPKFPNDFIYQMDPTATGNFAAVLAKRYNGSSTPNPQKAGTYLFLDAIEIGNEDFDVKDDCHAGTGAGYQGQECREAQWYNKVVVQAAPKIRASSPRTLIGMFGYWWQDITHRVQFLTDMYNGVGVSGTNVAALLDYFNFHCYIGDPAVDESTNSVSLPHILTQLNTVVTSFGDTKHFWVTEIGWNSIDFSQATIASYYQSAMDIMRTSGVVDRFNLFTMAYDPGGAAVLAGKSIVQPAGLTPHFWPAATTIQNYAAAHPSWGTTTGTGASGQGGVQADYLNFHYDTTSPTSGGTPPNLVPVNLDPGVDIPTYNGGQGIPSITTAWKLIQNKMQQYSTTMDVWCTETGFAINTNPNRSTYAVVSQATQWAYLKTVMDSCRTSSVVTHIFPFTLSYDTTYPAPNYRDGMSLVQGAAGSPQYTTAFTSYKGYTRAYPNWGSTPTKTTAIRLVVRGSGGPGGGGTRSTGIRLKVEDGGTVYLLGLASTSLPSANQLVATTLSAPTNITADTKLGSAVGWGEVTSQGTTNAWAASGSAPIPTGGGFLWDDPAIESQSLLPGTYTASLRLNTTGTGATLVGADIHCRLYKRSPGGPGGPSRLSSLSGLSGTSSVPHVCVIALENHGYDSTSGDKFIVGNSSFPNVNSLRTSYGYATQAYAVTHPSLPNYIALACGSKKGITTDTYDPAANPLTGNSLVDQLAGAPTPISWKHYAENLPSQGYLGGDTGGYIQHHNPWVYFKTVRTTSSQYNNIVDYSNLATDLSNGTAPPFMYIQPNNTHNGHSGTDAQCETFVSGLVSTIQASTWYTHNNGQIVLWWDETHPDTTTTGLAGSDANPGGGRVLMIVISAQNGAAPFHDDTGFNHYGLLRALENLYGVSPLNNAVHSSNGDPTPLFDTSSSGSALLTASQSAVLYAATAGGSNPASQAITLTNTGSASASYTTASSQSWLSVSPSTATMNAGATGTSTLSVDITGLAAGSYSGTITYTYTGGRLVVTATLIVSVSGPPSAFTLYLANAASSTLGTADTLYTTAGSPTTTSAATKLGTATGYGQIYAQGTTSAWPASGSEIAPSGVGWLLDTSLLEGNSLQLGTFSSAVTLKTSGTGAATITADVLMRLRKRSASGTYSLICNMAATAQSIPTTPTLIQANTSIGNTIPFATGDKLYLEVQLHVITNPGGSGQTVTISFLSTDTTGFTGSSNASIGTPGYLPTPPPPPPGGTYTLIADCMHAGQTLLPTKTVFHPTFTTAAGISFLSGERLYLDVLLQVTSNNGPSTQNVTLSDLSTNSSGGMSTADVITPGYAPIGGGGSGGGGPLTGFEAGVLALAPQAFYLLDETVGTIAYDSSGNGYDATVSGATLSQPGAMVGSACMAFPAEGGLTLPITLKPSTWKAASLLFWININDGTGWHFIVFVENASGIAVYLDSVLTQGDTGSPIYLGENFDFAGTLAAAGSLDDVALFNFALSPAQIIALYSLVEVSGSYLQTSLNGAPATWTWDTSHRRLLGTQSSGVCGVLQYTGFSRADMYVEADFDLSDSGGIVVRMVDSNNAYLLSVQDSASAANPNTIQLYSMVAGTLSALSSPIPTLLPRGHISRFRLDIQGTQLTASVDGVVLVTVSDASITGAGSGALLCGLNTNDSVQCYSLRIQPYGDDLNGKHLLTRLTLGSTDPISTPQVQRLVAAAYGPQIGAGTLIPSVDNRKVFMNRILDDAGKQSNYAWNIDQDLELSFNYRQAVPAPWVLQSGNTGLPSDIELDTNLLVEVSGDLYRNRQTLTNVTQTAHYPDEFVGDGQTQSFTLRYPIAVGTVPTITLLPDETTLLVGKKGTSGADWYYAEGDATIAQDTAGTPLSVFARIHVDFTGTFTDDVTVNNQKAQDALALLQGGGTGIVEAVEDGKGMFYDAALTYAQSLLDRYCVTDDLGNPTGRTITFLTYRDGLSVGMLLSLFVPEENLYGVHVQITAIDITFRTQPQSTLLYAYLVTATELAATHSWQKFIASGFLD